MDRVKNSVGIWAFGPNATRFMPAGYHAEVAGEDMPAKVRRVTDGLGDLVDGYEFHYPGEVNEDNLEQIERALGPADLYCIALGLFNQPKYALGSFINPNKKLRREALETTRRGIELAAAAGSKFIIWPGGEGYNYSFQIPYAQVWDYFIDAIAEAVSYAKHLGVTVLLEHKNSEPAMKILMRDIGMTLFVVNKIKEKGVSVSNLKINMDWQHLIMNGEPLAEYASLLAAEKLLGHQHGNSGWGNFDDDNMVGASYFMQTLELALVLRRYGYGRRGERIGFDLYPYTEDQVAAVKRSIYQWEFIDSLAAKIDDKALKKAQKAHDAVAAYEAVYQSLGLDQKFIQSVHESRKK
ncbi:MAG TPA: TIM barrel protein [Dehalococcoidales bacterium]|nr:TIM barrel protein [Dehalococcoidales bacterium]